MRRGGREPMRTRYQVLLGNVPVPGNFVASGSFQGALAGVALGTVATARNGYLVGSDCALPGPCG